MQEEEFLGWLIHQKKHTEIPEVTDEMKDKLIETFPHVAVIFCKCRKTFKSRIVAKIQCNGEWKAFYKDSRIFLLNMPRNYFEKNEKNPILISFRRNYWGAL